MKIIKTALAWGLMLVLTLPLGFALTPSVRAADQSTELTPAKKKKKANNYRSLTAFTVSGDQDNSDAAVIEDIDDHTTFFYRRVAIPDLRVTDPPPSRLLLKSQPVIGFTEENWAPSSSYLLSDDGYVWIRYGYNFLGYGDPFYDWATGDHRYFSYYGGAKAKKKKKQAYKYYDFTATGGESDVDATAQASAYHPDNTYYYRRVPVAELKTGNLVDFRLYKRNLFFQGFDSTTWTPVNSGYFITDGNLYVAYAYKDSTNNRLYDINNGEFRFYLYSDGKKKKKKLTKQYYKRYSFNVPSGAESADKSTTESDEYGYTYEYFYTRAPIAAVKMNNYPNMQVMKRNSYSNSVGSNSWSSGSFQLTDGVLWIISGVRVTDSEGNVEYTDTGSGIYQVFQYK